LRGTVPRKGGSHRGQEQSHSTYRRKKTKTGDYSVVTLPDGFGGRKDVMLGGWGTAESKAEYSRVIAEWSAGGLAPLTTHADITVNEVLVLYLAHAKDYYRHEDGTQTNEVRCIKDALKWMTRLYGHTMAKSFTTVSLETIRQTMVDGGLCRKRINKDVARIRRLFRWAGAKRIIPASVFHELATLEGLRAGRSRAKETAPVGPVALDIVNATLPYLPEVVADLVRLQADTGKALRNGNRENAVSQYLAGLHGLRFLNLCRRAGKGRSFATSELERDLSWWMQATCSRALWPRSV
jgi:hypothetical protein